MKLALVLAAAAGLAALGRAVVRDYRRVNAAIDEAIERGRCREVVMLDGRR